MASKIVFFMGVPAAGKTYWASRLFPDYTLLSMLSYQDRLMEEHHTSHGVDKIPFPAYRELLMKASELLLTDALERIAAGEPVVIEGTFYKAKRRIAFTDAIRQISDEPIDIYLVSPDEARFAENVRKRDLTDRYESLRRERGDIEYPNLGEGFSGVFEILGGQIVESHTPADKGLADHARAELAEEARQRNEEAQRQGEARELFRKLRDSELPFLHICEVCGKRESLTAQQAFQAGWDYPPTIGPFGVIAPRTCGNCGIKDTLWWAVTVEKKSLEQIRPAQKQAVSRISREPWNLLAETEER